MVHIIKMSEPSALQQAKREGLTDYDNMETPVKNAIKEQLFHEQHGLCAYCMRRIDIKTMQIEHYIAQHSEDHEYDSELTIDYRNMFGVCPGGKGSSPNGYVDLTCDQHRKNTTLMVNPLKEQTIQQIRYKADGTIYSESDPINHDLDIVLNLNCKAAKLKLNRQAAMNAFCKNLKKKYAGKDISIDEWKKLKNYFLQQDPLWIEYTGMFIEFIDRKIKQRQPKQQK